MKQRKGKAVSEIISRVDWGLEAELEQAQGTPQERCGLSQCRQCEEARIVKVPVERPARVTGTGRAEGFDALGCSGCSGLHR